MVLNVARKIVVCSLVALTCGFTRQVFAEPSSLDSPICAPHLKAVVYVQRGPNKQGSWQANLIVDKFNYHNNRLGIETKKEIFSTHYDEGINEVRLSPDGDHVLAAINLRTFWRSNLSDLWVFDTIRSTKRRLTRDWAGYHDLRWSPDKKYCSYISDEGIPDGTGDTSSAVPPEVRYVQNLTTGRRHRLSRDTASYVWMPRGHLLLTTSKRKDGLLILSASGRKHFVALEHTKQRWLGISADGSILCAVRGKHLHLFSIPRKESEMCRRYNWRSLWELELPEQIGEVALSHDGRYLAVTTIINNKSLHGQHLSLLDVQHHWVTVVGVADWLPARLKWSSHGSYLMFLKVSGGTSSVVSVAMTPIILQPLQQPLWSSDKAIEYQTLVNLISDPENIDWIDDQW